jgi:hypothetical protein
VVVTFDLERFEWAAPDRLQLAGTFAGLGDGPPGPPTLVVHGAERTHRLEAVTEDDSGPPQDGRPWTATFAWGEAPEPFDDAELQLGGDVVVELPQPHAGERSFGDQRLAVRQARSPQDMAANGAGAGTASERLRLQGELVAAQEEAREQRAIAERAMEELSRAQQDLEAERERHTADAERFRDGLATVRASAEEALAEEQRISADLRSELEQAVTARNEAESWADTLRERIGELEKAQAENEQLRTELETVREQAEATRVQRDGAHTALGEAREDAKRLLERLVSAHGAWDESG